MGHGMVNLWICKKCQQFQDSVQNISSLRFQSRSNFMILLIKLCTNHLYTYISIYNYIYIYYIVCILTDTPSLLGCFGMLHGTPRPAPLGHPSSTLKQLQLIPIFSEHMALSWSGISPTTTWGEIHGLLGNIHGKIMKNP